MEQKKSVKRLVNEKVTRHDVTRHCEVASHFPHWALHNCTRHCEERSDEAIHSIDCRVGLRLALNGHGFASALCSACPPRNDEYCNGNPPTLTLPLEGGREQVSNNSDNPQSLIHDKNLTSYRLNDLTTSRKVAFTLAEVLITLGVIGIVAAMTIPTLISRYQEKQNITHLKKAYSTIQQAFQMCILDYGTLDEWGMSKIRSGRDEDGNTILDLSGPELIINRLGKYLRHEDIEEGYVIGDVKSLDGRDAFTSWKTSGKRYIRLNDGVIIGVGLIENTECSTGICGDFWLVLPQKNLQLGYNVFYFYIYKNGLGLTGTKDDKVCIFPKYCDIKGTSLAAGEQGRGCTAWVILNGNMDYLRDNNLSW